MKAALHMLWVFFLDSYGVLLYSFYPEKKVLINFFYSRGNQRYCLGGIRTVY